ncbi:MAG: ABC transporter ATP-binding protein [Dehalococcoidales bacterium]|nr:ABC transporter ATP-binding protein [Dehalococcoidales bacterium]
MADILLQLKELRAYFFTAEGVTRAVDGISYDLREAEIMALVGESGSGKSVSALSVLRLLRHPGRIIGGQAFFHQKDLFQLSEKDMRNIRGRHIAMVFQEPMTSLNPVMRIGEQIAEAPGIHLKMGRKAGIRHALQLLQSVGIHDAEERYRDYPHQFSGGMRQRVMIAMALSCNPEIMIADEPTTALDVTVQAQILDMMTILARETHTAIILITHNLGIVARYADRVNVMYAGKIVESGSGDDILARPQHPYTQSLLQCVPRIDKIGEQLSAISGKSPNLGDKYSGCPFLPRCPESIAECSKEDPPLESVSDGHRCACFGARK